MMRWSIGLAGALSACALFGASLPACTPPPDPALGSTELELAVEGEGSVSVEETATVCPPTCAASQDLTESGATWTVTATPAEGWELARWEALGADASCPGGTSASFTEEVPAGGASYACRAVFERLGTTDPQDLGLDPNGDDALDVVVVDSWRTPDGGLVIGATVAGAWPPDDTLYSWYVGFTLHASDGAPIGTATLQRHAGARSTPITGIPTAAVEFVEADDGVYLVVAPPIDATHVSIESGVQAASPGTRVSDAVPDAGDPLPISTRESDPP